MRKKIDISATENAQLTSAGGSSDLAYLKANGPRALPSSPTASGWSADAIRKQLYKQPEILFAWLKTLGEAQLDLAQEVDDYLDGDSISKDKPRVFASYSAAEDEFDDERMEEGTLVFVLASDGSDLSAYRCGSDGLHAVGQSFATFLGRITDAESDISTLQSYFTSGKAKKAISDEDGNSIKETYGKNSDVVHKYGEENIIDRKNMFGTLVIGQGGSILFASSNPPLRSVSRTAFKIKVENGGNTWYVLPYDAQNGGAGNTYTFSTSADVATAKSEALASAAATAQSKVDALAEVMDFSNGSFGTIKAGTLKVTKMEVVETKTKTATVEDQFLEMLAENTVAYGSNYVGFVFAKYDATNDFFVGIYNDTLMIGDCTATRTDGKITSITPVSLEPIMSRAQSNALENEHLLEWDEENHCAKDAGMSLSTFSGQEATRQSNETARELAETGRANAELARVGAETSRANAETARALQEKYRVINHPYAITQAEYNALSNGGVFGVHLSTPLVEGDDPELICTVYASQALAEAADETYIFEMQNGIMYPAKDVGGDAVYLNIPALPVEDGHYLLGCTVSSGVGTIAWEADE